MAFLHNDNDNTNRNYHLIVYEIAHLNLIIYDSNVRCQSFLYIWRRSPEPRFVYFVGSYANTQITLTIEGCKCKSSAYHKIKDVFYVFHTIEKWYQIFLQGPNKFAN